MPEKIGYVQSVTRKLTYDSSGGSGETFAVLARLPGQARASPAYFKVSPEGVRPTFVANELLANKVALLRGLPVPETTVCVCRLDQLVCKGATLRLNGSNDPEYIRGVASLDNVPHHLKQRHSDPNELMLWPYISESAVFDELMLNVDRTRDNLLRLGPRNYLLIDHEKILGGPDWTIESLGARIRMASRQNHIADFIVSNHNDITIRKMINIASEYAKDFQIPGQIAFEVSEMTGLTRSILIQVIELLNARAKLLPSLISHYLRQADMVGYDD
jgi:hypothetical protein